MSDFKDETTRRNGFREAYGYWNLINIYIVLIKDRLNFYPQIPVICLELDGAQTTKNHVSLIYERKSSFVD